METNYKKWKIFLNPDILKDNFISCAFYIAVYEHLKDYIITQPKTFFLNGFDENGFIYSSDYKKFVVNRKEKNIVNKSLGWFLDMNAINEVDIENYHVIREFRNKITHEMIGVIFDNKIQEKEFEEKLALLIGLLLKLEKWWIYNIELTTNPDNNFQNTKPEQIIGQSQMLLKIMIDILTDEDEGSFYYDKFTEFSIY